MLTASFTVHVKLADWGTALYAIETMLSTTCTTCTFTGVNTVILEISSARTDHLNSA